MKFLVLIFAVISIVNGQLRPIISTRDHDAVILKQNYDLNPDGSYVYNYETSNGIRADQQGYLVNPGTQNEAQVMQGSYSYTAPDGILYTITYVADQNGFRAEGAHLPTPPPVRQAPRFGF